MIRSVEFDCFTQRERNQRGASIGATMALAARVKEQKQTTLSALARIGAHVPPRSVLVANTLEPNRIDVQLTRIAPGDLDDDGPDDALKNVRDAVAHWLGIDDKRGTIVTWHRGQQEHAAQHVYRVRIEIRDLSPGEPKVFILAETASAGRAAKSRVKRLVNAAVKKNTDAVAGELRSVGVKFKRRGNVLAPRDAGDEQPARELASCDTCGAAMGFSCIRKGLERLVHGVHVARARAAGLHVEPDDRAAVKPARGVRRVVPPAQPALVFRKSWAVLPWEQPGCDACAHDPGWQRNTGPEEMPLTACTTCNGTGRAGRRLAHLPRFDALDNPPEVVRYAVPPEHAARWPERTITLHRRPTSSPKLGEIWLYETTTPPKET